MKAELTLPPELVELIADKIIEKLKPLILNNDRPQGEDRIFTVGQLSEYIGLSKQWIYNNKKKIPISTEGANHYLGNPKLTGG